MRIYFARHGESQANVNHIISNRDLPHGLTSRGRTQAKGLADYLSTRRISCIYTSSVLRAVETSRIIASRLSLDYVVDSALRDFDCGIMEGRSDEAAWQEWYRTKSVWQVDKNHAARIEGGESFHEAYQRFAQFVDKLRVQYAGTQEEIVCVTHGGICGLLLPLILINVDEKAVEKNGFSRADCIVAEEGAGELRCIEWNGQPYASGRD